jgi:hypothetical protein
MQCTQPHQTQSTVKASLKNCHCVKSKLHIKEPEENLWEQKGPDHIWHDLKRLDYIFMGASVPSITCKDSLGFLRVTHILVRKGGEGGVMQMRQEEGRKKSYCDSGRFNACAVCGVFLFIKSLNYDILLPNVINTIFVVLKRSRTK